MEQQSQEDKKPNFSNLPRGAIGIKGLPVNRNTRLPSIRSPRDLTLGAQPKRTFVPNIPVRREKRPGSGCQDSGPPKFENEEKGEKKHVTFQAERGRMKGKGRGNIVQMQGSIFGEGFAANTTAQKDKHKESYQRAGISSSRMSVKKENAAVYDASALSRKFNKVLGDKINHDQYDNEGEDNTAMKPICFPLQESLKTEEKIKSEVAENFKTVDVAKEMGYDIKKVAKFIKKEKGAEEVERNIITSAEIPKNEISEIITNNQTQLLLLQFPQCVTTRPRNEELDANYNRKGPSNVENVPSSDQKTSSPSLSSLPEGYIGKFQILKSGRARLVLGSINFDLDSVNALQSRHEVASVKTNSNTGDITVLGHMEHKLNFAPDIESVLS